MLAATRPVSIAVLPSVPITSMRRMVQEPAGDWTLEDVVDATGLDQDGLTVSLDGRIVTADYWAQEVPQPGSSVIVRVRPAGVGFVWAVAAAAEGWAAVGAYATAVIYTAVVSVAVSYATAALSNALFAPSENETDTVAPGVRRTIAGGRNSFEPYAPIPQVLGKHRLFPPLAARSYTTEEDGKLYQYALFTFGFGALALSELKINDDPIFKSTTSISYTGVMDSDGGAFVAENGNPHLQLELRQGTSSDAAITLFSTDVQEKVISLRLKKSRGWVRRTTDSGATQITVIVGCPNGLIWRTESGKVKERTVRIKIRYRAAGGAEDAPWTDVQLIKLTKKTASSVYGSRTWSVSEGTYEVEVKRVTEEGTFAGITDITEWTSMLINRSGSVVNVSNLCLVAAKIKITNNFSSLVDQLNAVAQTVCLDWNGSSWVEQATSNPASLFRHVLQGDANKRAVADARINLTELAAWHVECTAKGYGFNYVTQGRTTVLEMLRQVAAAGRGSPGMQDGLFTVVRENDLSGAPVQHFTPRNVRSFQSVRRYVEPPHAFKVQFVDPESGYLDTERIVPADGYTTSSATSFERLDMPGITDPDQAYSLGRYYLAQLTLRPEDYVIETDFEHLDCVRGDWVKFNHDVILVGLAAGRVVSVTQNGGGDATAVVLDQECPMAAATYGIRFRKTDGSTVVATVVTSAGYQTTLTFSTPILAANPQPAAGDLFLFGESGDESIDLIVKDINPLDELSARLTLHDAAPGVLTADSGTIPAYDPQITIPPEISPNLISGGHRINRPRFSGITSSDVRDEEGRGPVIRRGLRVRLQPAGVSVV